MNTIICFCSCWNDGSHCVTTWSPLPENLPARICGVSEPKKTGWLRVMCQQAKEQMLELPPLVTNKQIDTHMERISKTSHISCLFPTRLARRKRDIIWLWMMARRWSGEALNLQVSVCQFVGDFVSLPVFLESVLFSTSTSGHNTAWSFNRLGSVITTLWGLSVSE